MDKNVIPVLMTALGTCMVIAVKHIPTVVKNMLERVRGAGADPALRCAVMGALAYLVQPHDIMPDDAPGGYGFVEDDVIPRVAHIEYLNVLPPDAGDLEKEREYYQMGASTVPLHALAALQNAVTGMAVGFQVLRRLPPELLEVTTQQTNANPLQMNMPSASPGFTPSMPPSFDTGHWSGRRISRTAT